MSFLTRSDIEINKLIYRYGVNLNVTYLSKDKKEAIAEINKKTKPFKVLQILSRILMCFCICAILSIVLFGLCIVSYIFKFSLPINLLALYGENIKVGSYVFIISMVVWIILHFIKKFITNKANRIKWDIDYYKEKLKDAEDDLEKIANRPPIDKINNEIKEIERIGREYYEKYMKLNKQDDLESSAKCGNPAAIITLVINRYLCNQLTCITCHSGFVKYNYDLRNPNFESADGLISYCKCDLHTLEHRGYFLPYKQEYESTCDSIEYLFWLLYMTERNSDESYEDKASIVRIVMDIINKGNIIPSLASSVQKFKNSVASLYTFSDADLKRISDKVNEQFNPTTKPSDVEWVYVPDVSDM